MYRINELYDLEHTVAKEYLSQFTYPWEALSGIKDLILKLG
ncbi:MAG: UDP-N-acetylglucosamine pyrophosphorylase, partial [Solobacterium sp.]|nr:UDP-N-acetylglucosamine pyrophosphorylase [Solobacterium sp.]